MCTLHCIMAAGRLLGRFLEGLCSGDPNKVMRAGVQTVLDGAHTVVRLGYAASLDGEEVCNLLQTWEQVRDAACMDATHADGCALLEMRELLRELYHTYQ